MAGNDKVSTNCRRPGAWLFRPTLSRKIALAMIVSLVAIQLQAFLQIHLFSAPEFRMVGVRWLAETVSASTRAALAVPAAQRANVLKTRQNDGIIRSTWSRAEPTFPADDIHSPLVAPLAATLKAIMGGEMIGLRVSASFVDFRFPTQSARVFVDHTTVVGSVIQAPVPAGGPDVLMQAGVKIGIQGLDGTWMVFEPVGFTDAAIGTSLPALPLLAGGAIITLASTLMARRLLKPLDGLVSAAERVGITREPIKVPTEGMQEFAAVGRAFEDMQNRLLRFVEDRTQLLAAISHDLRTSLTRLRLSAETAAPADTRAAIIAELDDMQSMVDSTLAFASGHARAVPNQTTDVAALLISLVDEASDGGRDCTYRGPDHADTFAHPVSLKRALHNVIDNALIYGKRAQVTLLPSHDALTIHIDDAGSGIPAERHEEAFAPFRRLDPARGGEHRGVGLGLTIARDVITSHGGQISLGDAPAGGVRVSINLPKTRSSAR